MKKEKIIKISEEIIRKIEEEELPISEKIQYIKALSEFYQSILKFFRIEELTKESRITATTLAELKLEPSEVSILEDFVKKKKREMEEKGEIVW
jgi:uncharacterized protein YjaG (DUF416 family)